MRKPRYSHEQIAAALRQAEIGTLIADITRKLGISEAIPAERRRKWRLHSVR